MREKGIAIIEKGNMHGLVKLSIFLLIVVGFNPDLNSIRIVWWGVEVFSLATMLSIVCKKSIPIINPFTIWMFLFLLWSTASYFWSVTPNYAFDMIKILFVNMVTLWLLSCVIQSEKDITQLLRLIVYAIAINAIYILFSFDLSLIGEVQIGGSTLREGWNSNAIGIMMAFSTLISLILIKTKVKNFTRILYYLIIVLTTTIVLFTGSRKALFFVLFGYTMYTILTNKNHKIINFFKVFLILFVAYLAIMNIPELYNVLGWRLEGLYANFTGKGTVDSSIRLRMLYIEYGVAWFKEQPILGYGINNYRVLLDRTISKTTYAHNNYIELLVDVGIIGTFLHYIGYFYVLKNITKPALNQKEPIYVFLFVMLVAILIAQYGFVTYSDFLISLFLCISFTTIRIRGMRKNGN